MKETWTRIVLMVRRSKVTGDLQRAGSARDGLSRVARSAVTRPYVAVIAASLVLGAGLATGEFHLTPDALAAVRRPLVVTAGAVLFGAGLMQLAARRVDRTVVGSESAVALLVLGLATALVTGQGALLHRSEELARLNPLGATLVGSMAILALVSGRSRGVGRRPESRAALWLACTLGGFLALVALHRLLGVGLDPALPIQLALFWGVAALWFGTARGQAEGDADGGWSHLAAALGAVWAMRGLAVLDPVPWGVASAVLLALVGMLALTDAAGELSRTVTKEKDRIASAETALAAATEALDALDRRRRDTRHGSRNSMLALRLATRTLAVHGERLDEAARLRLGDAIVEEVAKLESLLTGEREAVSALDAGLPLQRVGR
jgi:hypothetical protein